MQVSDKNNQSKCSFFIWCSLKTLKMFIKYLFNKFWWAWNVASKFVSTFLPTCFLSSSCLVQLFDFLTLDILSTIRHSKNILTYLSHNVSVKICNIQTAPLTSVIFNLSDFSDNWIIALENLFSPCTGNSEGVDPDGIRAMGVGQQEQFYGCSDVKIVQRCQAWDANCRNQHGKVQPSDQVWAVCSFFILHNTLYNIARL